MPSSTTINDIPPLVFHPPIGFRLWTPFKAFEKDFFEKGRLIAICNHAGTGVAIIFSPLGTIKE
jgi:hypothetical protein